MHTFEFTQVQLMKAVISHQALQGVQLYNYYVECVHVEVMYTVTSCL